MIHLTLSQLGEALKPTLIRFPDKDLYNQTFLDSLYGQERFFSSAEWKALQASIVKNKEVLSLEDLVDSNPIDYYPTHSSCADLELLQACSLLLPSFKNLGEKLSLHKEITIEDDQKGVSFVTLDNRDKIPQDYNNQALGSLYICLPSARNLPEKLIASALNNGYDYIIAPFCHLPKELALRAEQRIIWVQDAVYALQLLAKEVRKKVNPLLIAITGSSGKTSVKEILKQIFSHISNLKFIATKGNLNNHLGVPMTLLNLSYQDQIAIVEHGANHKGELELLTSISQPDIALINNVQPAHTEGFGGIEGVAQAKTEIFNHLHPYGVKILNLDSYTIEQMFDKEEKQELVTISSKDDQASFYIDPNSISCHQDGSRFTLNYPKLKPIEASSEEVAENLLVKIRSTLHRNAGKLEIETNLIGKHNIYNIAVASAVALYLGIDPDVIKTAVTSINQGLGRGKALTWKNTLLIDDAYNANPGSLKASLESFSYINKANKFYIIGKLAELTDSDLADFYAYLYYNFELPSILAEKVKTEGLKVYADLSAFPQFKVLSYVDFQQLSPELTLEELQDRYPVGSKFLKLSKPVVNYPLIDYVSQDVVVVIPPYSPELLYPIVEKLNHHLFQSVIQAKGREVSTSDLDFALCFKGSNSSKLGLVIDYFLTQMTKDLKLCLDFYENGLEKALKAARQEL